MIKRTAEEWDLIIEDWGKMNISMAAYCRQKEINYWTFRENIKKRTPSKSIKTDNHAPLVKITPRPAVPESSGADAITLIISNRFRLQIPDDFRRDTLLEILDVLDRAL